MTQKPLAQRLDEIDSKIDELNKSFEGIDRVEYRIAKLVESIELSRTSFESFEIGKIDIDAVKTEINLEIAKVFSTFHSVSMDWLDLINYCNRNKITPRKIMSILQVFNDDLFGVKPRENKEE